MEYLKVEGRDSLVRDTSNMAIINTSTTEYEEYIARRNAVLAEKEEMSMQRQELNTLKSEISEIKQMLALLIKDR